MKSSPGSRKERLPASLPREARQIAHQLLNQLTVINLCSFKLRTEWAAAGAATLSHNVESLERAVEEATRCAERLSRAIAASAESQAKNRQPLKYRSEFTTSFRCLLGYNKHAKVT